MNIFAKNEKKTLELGKKIGEDLLAPCSIYLKGDLGSGKTYISKGIAESLNITEDITSPTFTIINEYFSEKNSNPIYHLYHLDLYRLDGLNTILDLGLEDFVNNDNTITIIEWSEKLEDYKFTDNFIEITITYRSDGRDFIINMDSYKNKLDLEKGLKELVNTWN